MPWLEGPDTAVWGEWQGDRSTDQEVDDAGDGQADTAQNSAENESAWNTESVGRNNVHRNYFKFHIFTICPRTEGMYTEFINHWELCKGSFVMFSF